MRYVCFILLGIFYLHVNAQTQEADSAVSYLSLGTGISSASNYYGQTAEERLPFLSLDASYKHKTGFSLSASAYKLLDYSGLAELDLGIGYERALSATLGSSVGYSYFYYPENSPLLQSAYKHAFYASLSNDFNFLIASISATYALGSQKDVFTSFTIAKEINLGSLLNDKDYVSFSPSVDITAGTQRFYNTYFVSKNKKVNPNAKPSKLEEVTTTDTSFDVLSYSLYLPMAYNRAHYTLEFTTQLSALNNKANLSGSTIQPFFNLNFYYLFY